jgi:hypothetical protein
MSSAPTGAADSSPRRQPWEEPHHKMIKAPAGAKEVQGCNSFAPTGASQYYLSTDPTAHAVGYKYVAPTGATEKGIAL